MSLSSSEINIVKNMLANESSSYPGERYLANNNTSNDYVQLRRTNYLGKGKSTLWQTCAQVCTDGCGTEQKSPTHQNSTAMGNKINAEIHPYIVLPMYNKNDVMIGDLGVVIDTNTNRSSYVIYAEVGPAGKIGEMSLKVFGNLGLKCKNNTTKAFCGYDEKRFITVMLPGSGAKYGYKFGRVPKDSEEIERNASSEIAKLFQDRKAYYDMRS